MKLSIVKCGKKRTIPDSNKPLVLWDTLVSDCLSNKVDFQAVKIYFLTFSGCFFFLYLQPIRNKLLKTSSVFYPTKWGKYRPKVGYNPTTVRFLPHCPKFLMGKTRTLWYNYWTFFFHQIFGLIFFFSGW